MNYKTSLTFCFLLIFNAFVFGQNKALLLDGETKEYSELIEQTNDTEKEATILGLSSTQPASGSGTQDKNMVSGGFGIGLGVFYPRTVNNYIGEQTSHLIMTDGFGKMVINFSGKGSISIRLQKIFEISGFIEFAWAPKLIIVDMEDSYYYSFTKISPGISPKIHIPIGTGRHSIFIAPALTYNFLKFKDGQYEEFEPYKDKCWGAKMQLGFNLDLRKITLRPYVGYDHVKATKDWELNYSGGQIGVDLHF